MLSFWFDGGSSSPRSESLSSFGFDDGESRNSSISPAGDGGRGSCGGGVGGGVGGGRSSKLDL